MPPLKLRSQSLHGEALLGRLLFVPSWCYGQLLWKLYFSGHCKRLCVLLGGNKGPVTSNPTMSLNEKHRFICILGGKGHRVLHQKLLIFLSNRLKGIVDVLSLLWDTCAPWFASGNCIPSGCFHHYSSRYIWPDCWLWFHYNLSSMLCTDKDLQKTMAMTVDFQRRALDGYRQSSLCVLWSYWNFSDMIWTWYNWDQLPEHTPPCASPYSLPLLRNSEFQALPLFKR